jgi:pimeloyl-ACP methyl ester carboxylesterase
VVAVFSGFTPSHRAGAGSSLVCLHGFMDTWRTWDLVLPALERHHDVLALTLPGHAGCPPLGPGAGAEALVDAVEEAMDAAGFKLAHLVGNSLGGYLALRLASRNRAATVTAFAPAGGWAKGDHRDKELLRAQRALHTQMQSAAPQAASLVSTAAGRRRATHLITTNYEHIPPDLLAHQMLGIASCQAAKPLIDIALHEGLPLEPEEIRCPVRIVWGTADKLLPWPRAASWYRRKSLPHADWVLLEGIGHCPQLDVPLETAQLILGFAQ